MSVTIEISNTVNLRRARTILGARSDQETAELAIDQIVKRYTPGQIRIAPKDLPDEFWDNLFSQPEIPSSVVIKAFEDEREDRF